MSNYLRTLDVDPVAIEAHEKGELDFDTILMGLKREWNGFLIGKKADALETGAAIRLPSAKSDHVKVTCFRMKSTTHVCGGEFDWEPINPSLHLPFDLIDEFIKIGDRAAALRVRELAGIDLPGFGRFWRDGIHPDSVRRQLHRQTANETADGGFHGTVSRAGGDGAETLDG